jgi:acyl-CoA-binding protein
MNEINSDVTYLPDKDSDVTNSLESLFLLKAESLKNTKLKLDNETKLKFYGLFKVATVGKIADENKKSVGFFDFDGKYKV